MAPLDESSAIAKFLDKRGPGIQQLAYRVSDLDALTERLRDQGIRLLYDARGVAPRTRGSTSSTQRRWRGADRTGRARRIS
ncbi:glyoxalase/Bleomycin resistance /Dioxygenase superfamily protein [Mycobacterium xenopi 4042]|uniref:Glyoxalase/Bleomycin resistance /Dioxygenase superfamily protein n=1 Tax=Mycobacterium xenopi 4042 TaxID=1299334 RepID=X8E460_MYCXE|nr:glyoxalase/Bleomycin resistance /Dioxygenase superfamily protein [Mycobacterium xenopi 4042]